MGYIYESSLHMSGVFSGFSLRKDMPRAALEGNTAMEWTGTQIITRLKRVKGTGEKIDIILLPLPKHTG